MLLPESVLRADFDAGTTSRISLPSLSYSTFNTDFQQIGPTLKTTFDTAGSTTSNPPGDGTMISAVYQGTSSTGATLYAYVYQIQINPVHQGDVTSLAVPWSDTFAAANFSSGGGFSFTKDPNGYSIPEDLTGSDGFVYKITGGAPADFASTYSSTVGLRDPSDVTGINQGSTDPITGTPYTPQLLFSYSTPLTTFSDILVVFSQDSPMSVVASLRDGGAVAPLPVVYSPAPAPSGLLLLGSGALVLIVGGRCWKGRKAGFGTS
jgi:hypothetical protein